MIPRFYYTLPSWFYLRNIFASSKIFYNFIPSKENNQSVFYYTNTARAGLRSLLSSISNQKLRIGVQVFTCHTVFQAIKKAGHDIVFLDMNNEYKLDLKYLNERKDKIDVLILTHTFGYPEQFDEIRKIIGNKIIIEDCAHAFLSNYKGRLCGTLGDASIYSFGLGKFPPIGAGGGVLLNNPKHFPKFSNLYKNLPKETSVNSLFTWSKIMAYSILLHQPFYGLIALKLGKRLDKKYDFIGKSSFRESQGFSFSRKILYYYYPFFSKVIKKNQNNYELITGKYKIKCIPIPKETVPNFYIVPIIYRNRDKLYDCLLKNNIEAGKHFERSIEWAKEFGYQNDCPMAEHLSKTVLTIPLHNSVKKNDIDKMGNLLEKHLNA